MAEYFTSLEVFILLTAMEKLHTEALSGAGFLGDSANSTKEANIIAKLQHIHRKHEENPNVIVLQEV